MLLKIFLTTNEEIRGIEDNSQQKVYTQTCLYPLPGWRDESLRVIIPAITANCPSDPRDEEHGELMVQ
jgi:hypothetical protein